MAHKFAEIAFTPVVRAIQTQQGSRSGYARMDGGDDYNHQLSGREALFIGGRDSFYLSSVGETGWPYLQHRGGPAGFMKVLDERTIGFADFAGNRQYVSTGNFSTNSRVALFFMDYPNRTRLKLLGRVRTIGLDEPELLARLEDADYPAQIERGFVIEVEAFDWNCPQHITPRFTQAEVEHQLTELRAENQRLQDTLAGSIEQQPSATLPNPPPTPEVLGEGPLELIVSGVRQLAPQVRAFELRDPKGGQLPAVEAGSHLRVPDSYSIGTRLRVDLPANHFGLHDDQRPALLIAGGIGITPIKAMAQALAARDADFHLHYAGRSRVAMPFRDRLQRQLADRLTVYSSDDGQRMDVAALLAAAADDAVIYVCGPQRLISAVTAAAKALGIARERVRLELFA